MSLICDEVTIIENGKKIKSGSFAEISDQMNLLHEIELELVERNAELLEKLKEFPWQQNIIEDESDSYKLMISIKSEDELRPLIAKLAFDCQAEILGLREKKKNLEELFIDLTGEK